jgi:hypothetical protein
MAAMVMIIMVFEVQLLGWCELAHCHRENLAALGHPLWVPQGGDIVFLGKTWRLGRLYRRNQL